MTNISLEIAKLESMIEYMIGEVEPKLWLSIIVITAYIEIKQINAGQ